MSAVDVLVANTQNSPIETLEMEYPIRVRKYAYDTEAGAGAGKQRGGFGIIRVNELRSPTMVTLLGDRSKDVAWGLEQGGTGAPTRISKIKVDGSKVTMPAMFEGERFESGEALEIRTPSGGGWGDPFARDPGNVLRDFLNELISRETAARLYGVVIDDQGEIDQRKTTQCRAAKSVKGQTTIETGVTT
jgi:N-methylhydantoinase B/oxoprolinase/acetone carboxylase alpha subunit